jgi:hypothetical protein
MDAAALSFADSVRIMYHFDKLERSYAIMITRRLFLGGAASSGLV